MNFAPHVTVACVVQRESRFLLVEELIEGRRVYNQPAGHWEDHETLVEAAVRETLEETGWRVQPQALVGVYQWRHPDNGETFLRFTFAARPLEHEPDRPLDSEIQRVLWLSRDELLARREQLRSPLVLTSVDHWLGGRRYPLELLAVL